jgi:hypothetical protein
MTAQKSKAGGDWHGGRQMNLRVQANANIICQIRSAKENLECGKMSV